MAPVAGRPAATRGNARRGGSKSASPRAKKVAKKRQLSPETRAKLAANLVKARAVRAAKRKGEQVDEEDIESDQRAVKKR